VRELTYSYFSRGPGNRRPPKVRRTSVPRNSRYKAWIRTLPSAVSGYRGCEAAHTGSDGGAKLKASDYSCIPLTMREHAEYHQIGKQSFERKYGLSCEDVVRRLNEVWFRFSREVK
jgi:hypothetical protein